MLPYLDKGYIIVFFLYFLSPFKSPFSSISLAIAPFWELLYLRQQNKENWTQTQKENGSIVSRKQKLNYLWWCENQSRLNLISMANIWQDNLLFVYKSSSDFLLLKQQRKLFKFTREYFLEGSLFCFVQTSNPVSWHHFSVGITSGLPQTCRLAREFPVVVNNVGIMATGPLTYCWKCFDLVFNITDVHVGVTVSAFHTHTDRELLFSICAHYQMLTWIYRYVNYSELMKKNLWSCEEPLNLKSLIKPSVETKSQPCFLPFNWKM